MSIKSRDRVILLHVLDTIDELNEYMKTCTDFNAFKQNSMLKRACSMCVISISELFSNLSEEFQQTYPHVNTRKFKQIRNIAAHNYGAINFTVLYDSAIRYNYYRNTAV